MKKNLYYHAVFKRTNYVKMFFLAFFLGISSWPRLILEVFLRKNMGERYFSLVTCVVLFFILFFLPTIFENIGFIDEGEYRGSNFYHIFWHNFTWYLFDFAFITMALVRHIQITRTPGVFDFARFSLSNGNVHPLFYRIRIFGKIPNPRQMCIIWEPLFCALVGILLILISQKIGIIIFWCSVIYSLSHAGGYLQGDYFIMDKIDELIANEEMADSFIGEKGPSETRGFFTSNRKPVDADLRQKIVESFFEDEERGFRAT